MPAVSLCSGNVHTTGYATVLYEALRAALLHFLYPFSTPLTTRVRKPKVFETVYGAVTIFYMSSSYQEVLS